MKWLTTTADEHVLCDDRGTVSEYRVRRDPVTQCYSAYDGELRIMTRLAIYPCQRECELRYSAERAHGNTAPKNRKGRYSKRESAA